MGRPAEQSSILAFAIMAGLAAPLLPFARLPENPLFNFFGPSSVGKTTALRVALSVLGHPNALHSWDKSARELEEAAAHHSHLVLTLNAAERASPREHREILSRVIHMLADGQSKSRSRVVQGHLPNLDWACITLSSSNLCGADMARVLGLPWKEQEMARFIDIPVAHARDGGIFDRLDRSSGDPATQAANLIQVLDAALKTSYGALLRLWIENLMRHDPAARIENLTQLFLDKVQPQPGLEERLARKFALVYAAGRLAVDAGLLPWSKKLPLRVTLRLYRHAYAHRTAIPKDLSDALQQLRQIIDDPVLVPVASAQCDRPIDFVQCQILAGFRLVQKGQPVIALRREGLEALFDPTVSRKIVDWICTTGAVLTGHGARSGQQLPIRLRVGGRLIDKPRFLVVAAKQLQDALARLPL